MPFSFSTALSGLRASSNALGVTGNNIANANTTAFKSSSIIFADVFANSTGVRLNGGGGAIQIGTGVSTAATPTNFSQGNLADGGSATAAAIQGNGFFVVKNSSGAQLYTRAGDFSINRDGLLVTPSGDEAQGYAAVDGVIPPGTALSSVKIPIGETIAPVVTSEVTVKMNLNSADAPGSVFHSPMQVFDSKGTSHTLDVTYSKQADGSYVIAATLDGNAATIDTGTAAPTLVFDSNGLLTSPTSLVITPDQTQLDGATLPSLNVNLFQRNPDGTIGSANITGFAAGSLTGLSISATHDGVLSAVYSNGQVRPIAQFALAYFNSQDGLGRLGGN